MATQRAESSVHVSVRQLVVNQLIVGTTGRTALSLSFMKPEPHNGSVVLLTCIQLKTRLVCDDNTEKCVCV